MRTRKAWVEVRGGEGYAIIPISPLIYIGLDRKAEQADGSGLDESHGPGKIFTATNNTMTWRSRIALTAQSTTSSYQPSPPPPPLLGKTNFNFNPN